jgi:hypothetical protein
MEHQLIVQDAWPVGCASSTADCSDDDRLTAPELEPGGRSALPTITAGSAPAVHEAASRV